MNEQDKQAFRAWYKQQIWGNASWEDGVFEGFEFGLEYARQQEPVAFAQYFALADASGKYIKKNYFSGQLEIYEEENQVPCSHKDTSAIAIYVTKKPPAQPVQPAVNEQDRLDAARYRWLFDARTEEECQNWKVGHLPLKPQDRVIGQVATVFLPKVAVDGEIDAAMAAEAEKAKGGV